MRTEKNKMSAWSIAIFIIIFCGLSALFLLLIMFFIYLPLWFWGPVGFSVILGFDIVWILVIKQIFKKYKKKKIFFMILGFAVSTAFLIFWLVDKLNIGHMFG
jgi:hypothetical protein